MKLNDYINCTPGTLYGSYRTNSFSNIFPTAADFLNEYKNAAIPTTINDDSVITLYYLLYSTYGNWTIGGSDENQFKYQCWSNIYMYGPTWEKRLTIQKKLRDLTEEELMTGSIQISNHAYAPGTTPSTVDTNELSTVDDQNVNKYTRSKLDAYQFLYDLLKVDVTKSFLDKFKPLFNPFAMGQLPLLYSSED